MRESMKVPHSEINAKLDEEKAAKASQDSLRRISSKKNQCH